MPNETDHDRLIRVDENVKTIMLQLSSGAETMGKHEDRISAIEGDMKAVKVQNGILSALAVGISAALKFWK